MQHFFNLRRVGQILCIVVLGCSSTLGLSLMREYHRRASTAFTSASELRRFIEIVKVLNSVAAERGPTNAMVAAGPGRADLAAKLAARRQRTDLGLDGLGTYPDLKHEAAAIQERLRYARRTVDLILNRPLAKRTAKDAASAVDVMQGVIDKSQSIVGEAAATVSARPASSVAGYAVLIRALSDMRDYAGRMGSALVVPIASALPLTQQQRSIYDEAEGHVFELDRLLAGSIRLSGDEATRVALDDVHARFFGSTIRTFENVLHAAGDGHYPLDREAFTASVQPGFRTLELLRDTVAERAWRLIDAENNHASFAFTVVTALTIIMIGLECLLLLAARNFIFTPLLDARESILCMASGNVEEPLERSNAIGEMGELFGALRLLRTRLRERDVLDREYRLLTEQLRHLADQDGLTGILNRGALERVALDITRDDVSHETVGLILIDIDHFKAINDSFGHSGGDYVLRVLACRWSELMPEGAVFARFGGEEFAALMPGSDMSRLRRMAEQLRQSAALPVHLASGTHVPVSASFGIAVASCGPDAWPSLVETADEALYAAKRAGRNRVVGAGETPPGLGTMEAA